MKLGLVLEGGASRTYFSAGVMDALLKENIFCNYVIGVSAGIANACAYCSNQPGRTLTIGQKYIHDKRYMGKRYLLNRKNKSYFNLKFVFDDIPNELVPFDYKAFKEFNGNCIAGVTNIETGDEEYIEVSRFDRQWQILRATCALPLLFPPIKIGDNYYMDGGIAEAVPLKKALADGCDKCIVVLTREKGYRKAPEKALKLAARKYSKYPNFSKKLLERTENYNSGRDYIEQLEREGKIFVFAPENTQGFGRTESDPQKLTKLFNEGFNSCIGQLDELNEYLRRNL